MPIRGIETLVFVVTIVGLGTRAGVGVTAVTDSTSKVTRVTIFPIEQTAALGAYHLSGIRQICDYRFYDCKVLAPKTIRQVFTEPRRKDRLILPKRRQVKRLAAVIKPRRILNSIRTLVFVNRYLFVRRVERVLCERHG